MAFGTYKQDLEALTVTYSKRKVLRPYSYSEGFAGGQQVGTIVTTVNGVYEYHRYAKRSYKFVGMNENMAKAKLQSLINQYNRDYYISEWNSSGELAGTFTDYKAGHKVQGNIYAQHTQGCFYEVVVNINEDDVKMDRLGYASPETLFSKENARTYD